MEKLLTVSGLGLLRCELLRGNQAHLGSNQKGAALLMARTRFAADTSPPLWVGNVLDGQILGMRAMSSSQMPAATAIFGDWAQVVVGEWGVSELATNPAANFTAGITGIRAMYTMDVGVRNAAAFSVATSIT